LTQLLDEVPLRLCDALSRGLAFGVNSHHTADLTSYFGLIDHQTNMEVLQKELRSLNQASRLTTAVDDVDRIIAELTAARGQVAAS
jgi:hypothetical protein